MSMTFHGADARLDLNLADPPTALADEIARFVLELEPAPSVRLMAEVRARLREMMDERGQSTLEPGPSDPEVRAEAIREWERSNAPEGYPVPPRPSPDEYGSLPVLDAAVLGRTGPGWTYDREEGDPE